MPRRGACDASAVTERTIAGAGVTLATTDEGDGPAVVLLHGLSAARRYVVMGSSGLRRAGLRTISYDARGHGASSPASSPSAYGYEQLHADLLAVLDGAGIERAVLAGVSMGAHTAIRLALEAPDRIGGLVVITPGYDPAAYADPVRLARWDALSAALRAGGIDGFAEAFGAARLPARWREAVVRALRQRMAVHEHLDAVADALRAVPRSAPFGELAELARIDCPAVVVGSRDEADPGHPLDLAVRYAELLPDARLLVEAEGDSPLAWQGGRVAAIIADVARRAA